MMKTLSNLLDHRWAALADLGCAASAAFLWLWKPGLGGWPLAIALLPWGARLLAGRFPFRRTPLDGFIALFLISAAGGLWAAYNPAAAWVKFWQLVGAVCVYYALAGQPQANRSLMAGLLGLFGVAAVVLFWLRPEALNADLAGLIGILALPLAIAWLVWTARQRRLWPILAVLFLSALLMVGLTRTVERGAWLGLGIVAAGWAWWQISQALGRKFSLPGRTLLIAGVAIPCLVACLAVFFTAAAVGGLATGKLDDFFGLAGYFRRQASDGNRLFVDYNTLGLLPAYWFTGGGLGAFSGIYSRYAILINHHFLSHSHNLYLDVMLEQGVLGGLALGGVYLGGAILGLRGVFSRSGHPFLIAFTVSLLTLIIHALTDDPLYSTHGAILLFVLPGMCVALTAPEWTARPGGLPLTAWLNSPVRMVGIGLALLVVVTGAIYNQPVRAAWVANLGAVALARAELAEWPARRIGGDELSSRLAPAETLLRQALELDPTNVAAAYRLGLIARERLDFETSGKFLELAYTHAPGLRGVNKALGYNYLWLGRPEEALPLLSNLLETPYELGIYIGYWRQLQRPDLARAAEDIKPQLELALREK